MKNLKLVNVFLSILVFGLFACQKNEIQTSQVEEVKQEQSKPIVSDIVFLDAITLSNKLKSGELSSAEVTTAYLSRILEIDTTGPAINAIIELNPDALDIAIALDNKFAKDQQTGLLHGVPVLLKANIDTNDKMATTAGSMALEGHYPSSDAQLVKNLRAAGAVILGKTNLSEWANFRSSNSSSGWSSLGGLTKNPYVLDRNACGSSSGSAAAVAAYLAPLAIGTETDGSIVCPSSVNGVVGIKPSVGRVSAQGIIPISSTQDTAGPMATTVSGAELLYQVMHGLEFEAPLQEVKLEGLRVGVWRNYFGAEGNPEVTKVFTESITALEKAGAVIVDQVEIEGTASANDAEYQVLLYEFKDGLNKYLKDAGLGFTLENIIEFNNDNAENVLPHFGQEIFELAQAKSDLNSQDYKKALQDSHIAMQEILNSVFAEHKIDVLIGPTNQPAWKTTLGDGDDFKLSSSGPSAISGYPNITVPMGNVNGLPVGLSFIGLENDDEKLIEIAKQFEAITRARIKPKFIESID